MKHWQQFLHFRFSKLEIGQCLILLNVYYSRTRSIFCNFCNYHFCLLTLLWTNLLIWAINKRLKKKSRNLCALWYTWVLALFLQKTEQVWFFWQQTGPFLAYGVRQQLKGRVVWERAAWISDFVATISDFFWCYWRLLECLTWSIYHSSTSTSSLIFSPSSGASVGSSPIPESWQAVSTHAVVGVDVYLTASSTNLMRYLYVHIAMHHSHCIIIMQWIVSAVLNVRL